VGKSFGDQADFQMPGTYFLSSDLDYAAPHNGDEDRHWLASLLGEQEVNMKLTPKKRIAWQWLFNTQSTEANQATRAEYPAPPAIAEGMGVFYWFTGAYGTIFWDDWNELTPNAPVVPGRENLDNNRNYACYEHYIHGLWRLFKHHGDLFNGQEKYLNEQTECSYDNGRTWYRLNSNALKRSGFAFARAIVKGDQILIAATQPYASVNQQSQLMVRYVQDGYRFYTTINLRGDEIFLGRATMPTGNSVPVASQTTLPPVGGGSGSPLSATVASYNCSTGNIVFGSTGGNANTVEFSGVGITGWTTNQAFTLEAGLRLDLKPITVQVRQSGVEGTPFVFDLKAYCTGTGGSPSPANTAPTVVNTVNPQSALFGTAYSLNVSGVFTDAQTPTALILSADRLPAGLSLNGTVISGIPTALGVSTVTLRAVDPGGLANTLSFVLTVSSTPVIPPTTGALTARIVNYNCTTGAITFGSTGGNNAPVEYSAVGVTGWTTNPNFILEAGLQIDLKPITINVRQNGVQGSSFIFDLKAYCITPSPPPVNTAPTVTNAVGPQSAVVGTAYSLNIGSVFTDSQTPIALSLLAVGLPAGLSLNGMVITGTPSVSGVSIITLRATDPGGLSNTTTFVLTVNPPSITIPPSATTSTPINPTAITSCGSPANTVGQALQVTGLGNINCLAGTFRVITTGGNGSAINYANMVGLNNTDPTNCQRVLDNPDMVRAINNPNSDVGTFQIRVTQGGTTSNTFVFNFKQHCTGGGARIAHEIQDDLHVLLLGNPVLQEWVEVEVQAAHNEPIVFRVVGIQGQQVSIRQVDTPGEVVRQRLWLGEASGVFLLQVTTPTRSKTIKLVRH